MWHHLGMRVASLVGLALLPAAVNGLVNFQGGDQAAREACVNGDAIACVTAGQAVATRRNASRDARMALELFQRGCDLGAVGACLSLSDVVDESAKCEPAPSCDVLVRAREHAAELLSPLCAHGDRQACRTLVEPGHHLPLTAERTTILQAHAAALAKECDAGSGVACLDLAALKERRGVGRDSANDVAVLRQRALASLRRECAGNVGGSCWLLYVEATKARRSASDKRAAVETGCRGGDGRCCMTMALWYAAGQMGYSRDRARSEEHYRLACQYGQIEACPAPMRNDR
jgi:uncharacterized protein